MSVETKKDFKCSHLCQLQARCQTKHLYTEHTFANSSFTEVTPEFRKESLYVFRVFA